jgi:regulator of sirC expression with transglutaminase-like and TPR domain
MVRHEPAQGKEQLIDVYDGGKLLTRDQAVARVDEISGRQVRDADFTTASKRAILVRMLHNLLGLARDDKDVEGVLRYLDGLLTLDPDAAEDRWLRAVLRYQTGRTEAALADVDRLLETEPEGIDLDRVRELRRLLMRP